MAALLAYKVSREVKGANLVMDPAFAQMLESLLRDEEARDAAIEALIRLEKGAEQQHDADARPTELSVVLFLSTTAQLDGSYADRYVREILGVKYGDASIATRDVQFVAIPDLDPSLTLNDGVARAYYSRLVELPQGRSFGEPDDAHSGRASDGTPGCRALLLARLDGRQEEAQAVRAARLGPQVAEQLTDPTWVAAPLVGYAKS